MMQPLLKPVPVAPRFYRWDASGRRLIDLNHTLSRKSDSNRIFCFWQPGLIIKPIF